MADTDSILDSIKKLLGFESSYTAFDMDIIIHINTVFSIMSQMGVTPSGGFSISDNSAIWSDFIQDRAYLEMVKSYVYMKVRMVFDTPTTSFQIDAFNEIIDELEWRLTNAEINFPDTPAVDPENPTAKLEKIRTYKVAESQPFFTPTVTPQSQPVAIRKYKTGAPND